MYIGERDIGETIRILRTERGISREELAERVGISRSHLNKIEADIKRPSIITYQKIMDVLEADISINDEATANVAPENEADLMNAVDEYSCAVTPQVRQTGNRLSGLAGTAYASLLT